MEENINATISNMLGYNIYKLAFEMLARIEEYPDWHGRRLDEEHRENALLVIRGMERHFPSFVEFRPKLEKEVETAKDFYETWKETEMNMLNRKYRK